MASFWVDKKVLLFGGSGFVGGHVSERLHSLGVEVAGFLHDKDDWFNPQFRGDVKNYDDVARAVGRFRPDIIINMAAQPLVTNQNHKDTLDTNIVGTYNIFLAAKEFGCQVFQMTSDKVYGESESGQSWELSALNGVHHPYDTSKVCQDVLAQMFAEHFGINTIILRSGNIYGEGDMHYDRLIPYLCRQLALDKPIFLRSDGTLKRDYIHVDDVVDAVVGLIERHGTPIMTDYLHVYNIGSKKCHSVSEIVDALLVISGKTAKINVGQSAENIRELKHQHMNYDKIKMVIGWTPKIDLETGLKRTYKYYAGLVDYRCQS